MELFGEVNELLTEEHLELFLAHNKCVIHMSCISD